MIMALLGHSDIVVYVFCPVWISLSIGVSLFLHSEQSQYVFVSQLIVLVILVQSGQSDELGNVFVKQYSALAQNPLDIGLIIAINPIVIICFFILFPFCVKFHFVKTA